MASGPTCWRAVRTSTASTGSGKRRTGRWARPAKKGGHRPQPNPLILSLPKDRGKPGVKRSILVEGDGGPLAVAVAGANVPDAQLLAATLDAVIVERPEPDEDYPQHVCLDKGSDNPTGWEATVDREYEPHIALIRDERPERPKQHPPRRWVVESTQSHYP
jgi:hypothetical protein